ncbi:hypothetical protein DMUE_2069 [Dictyocoela muelleri]|nr:hypothetical protein DMUE_2069 [Dictyocoela muelleri]
MYLDQESENYNEDDNNENNREDINFNSTRETRRKNRQPITKNIIECFLGLLQRDITLVEMSNILNLSYRTIKRLYKRYLNGEFQDLTNFKSASAKIRAKKKYLSYEKHIIASEIAANSCIKL